MTAPEFRSIQYKKTKNQNKYNKIHKIKNKKITTKQKQNQKITNKQKIKLAYIKNKTKI